MEEHRSGIFRGRGLQKCPPYTQLFVVLKYTYTHTQSHTHGTDLVDGQRSGLYRAFSSMPGFSCWRGEERVHQSMCKVLFPFRATKHNQPPRASAKLWGQSLGWKPEISKRADTPDRARRRRIGNGTDAVACPAPRRSMATTTGQEMSQVH